MRSPVVFSALLLVALIPGEAGAHPGGLDANGCHYDRANGHYHCHKEVPPNPNRNAPVKKSRENVCHDSRSPNYRTIRYFISYQSMDICLVSGGREAFGH